MIMMMIAFACVLAADQLSKSMVCAQMQEGVSSPAIMGMRLTHVANRRMPWASVTAVRLMAVVLLCLAAVASVTARKLDSLTTDVAIGAIIGGAAGNLLDGFNRQAVVDFIDLRVWPVFNIADAAIVSGAAVILWNLLR